MTWCSIPYSRNRRIGVPQQLKGNYRAGRQRKPHTCDLPIIYNCHYNHQDATLPPTQPTPISSHSVLNIPPAIRKSHYTTSTHAHNHLIPPIPWHGRSYPLVDNPNLRLPASSLQKQSHFWLQIFTSIHSYLHPIQYTITGAPIRYPKDTFQRMADTSD